MNWKYEIIIYWSNDDDAFVAEAPELAGCVAHGATQSEALTNANDAMALWLNTAQELRRVAPEPEGRRLVFA